MPRALHILVVFLALALLAVVLSPYSVLAQDGELADFAPDGELFAEGDSPKPKAGKKSASKAEKKAVKKADKKAKKGKGKNAAPPTSDDSGASGSPGDDGEEPKPKPVSKKDKGKSQSPGRGKKPPVQDDSDAGASGDSSAPTDPPTECDPDDKKCKLSRKKGVKLSDSQRPKGLKAKPEAGDADCNEEDGGACFRPRTKGGAIRKKPSAATSYDENRAKQVFWLASAAYCSDSNKAIQSKLQSWSCAVCEQYPGWEMVKIVKNTKQYSFGYVAKKTEEDGSTTVAVVFRGTVRVFASQLNKDTIFSLGKMIINCNQLPQESDRSQAHAGFVTAWNSLKKDVNSALVLALADAPGDIKLLFVGHSLGGAMAVLAAADLKESRPDLADKKIEVITYGSPRVGNEQFVEAFAKSVDVSWRIVHWRDAVPPIPPTLKNVGTEVFYNSDMSQYKVCPVADDKNCNAGLTVTTSVENHEEWWNGASMPELCNVVDKWSGLNRDAPLDLPSGPGKQISNSYKWEDADDAAASGGDDSDGASAPAEQEDAF